MFTDNSSVKAAICKGLFKSQKLLALAIRLKVLRGKYSIHLLVCHVAGTQMIAEWGGGVSQGLLKEGVMTGKISSCSPPCTSQLWSARSASSLESRHGLA